MKRFINRLWQEEDGVLTFEWVLIITLVVIGIVGGLAAARDAIIDELGDIAEATISFDQSYNLPGIAELGIGPSVYVDVAAEYQECGRGNYVGQTGRRDDADGEGP